MNRGRLALAARAEVDAALLNHAAEIDVGVARRERPGVRALRHRDAVSERRLLHIFDVAGRRRRHEREADRVRLVRDVAVHVAQRRAPVARVVVARVRHGERRLLRMCLFRRERQDVARRAALEVGMRVHRAAVIEELHLLREAVDADDLFLRLGDDIRELGFRHAGIALDDELLDRDEEAARLDALRLRRCCGRRRARGRLRRCRRRACGRLRCGRCGGMRDRRRRVRDGGLLRPRRLPLLPGSHFIIKQLHLRRIRPRKVVRDGRRRGRRRRFRRREAACCAERQAGEHGEHPRRTALFHPCKNFHDGLPFFHFTNVDTFISYSIFS